MLRATLTRRGGAPSLAELPYSTLTATRLANEVGSVSLAVPVGGLNDDARRKLGDATAWRDELAVYDDRSLLWVGPLMPPAFTREAVTLTGKDLFAWFDHRVLGVDRTYRATDLGIIFTGHAADAMRRDDSPGITVSPTSVGIGGDRVVTAKQRQYAGDAMRELCRSGVDFTMNGRELVLSSSRSPGTRLPVLAGHLADGPSTAPPADVATEVTILGVTRADGSQVVATATRDAPPEGLLQVVVNEPAVLDKVSARHAALTALDASPGLPFTATLLPGWAPWADLVPNRICRVAVNAGVRDLLGDYRLVSVTFNAEPGRLGVSGTFVPVEV